MFFPLTIEKNPGPGLTRFGLFNADGANYKGAGISGLIHDNRLDVLAVCKSWIREDAPDAVKLDMVPSNFAVLHSHRPRDRKTGRSKRGGGPAFIYLISLSASSLK